MKDFLRNKKRAIKWLVVLIILGGWWYYQSSHTPETITMSQFQQHITESDITGAGATMDGGHTQLTLTLKDGSAALVNMPTAVLPEYIRQMSASGTEVTVGEPPLTWNTIFFWSSIGFSLMWVTSLILTRLLGKSDAEKEAEEKMSGLFEGGLRGMGVPKPQTSTVRFADVAGIDEIRGQMEQLVHVLKNPGQLTKLGGEPPRGTLLVGPPGTAKTMLAKAVAGEAGVPFYVISASSVDGGLVGDGSKFFRKVFKAARKKAPSIIFIDEIDAVGKKRSSHDSKWAAQSLNQLLTEMDGFNPHAGVIVLAATNRPEDLDPALRRPGRFDREIQTRNPDLKGREAIMRTVATGRNMPLDEKVDLTVVARSTVGYSGAEVVNLLNEAALHASDHDKTSVGMDDFEFAREKLAMGISRPSTLNESERRITAVHEAGHALVALGYAKHVAPLYKVTIQPRSMALGMATLIPDEDRVHMSYRQLRAMLAVTFGGRMAEQLNGDKHDVTAGASSDLQKITAIASRMILELGFGTTAYRAYRLPADRSTGTLGDLMQVSETQLEKLDGEINELISSIEAEVQEFLSLNLTILKDIADELFEKETLTGDYLREAYGPRIRQPQTAAEEPVRHPALQPQRVTFTLPAQAAE